MPTTQNIVIDLNTRGANPVAFTHQGDTARSFVFEVYNNGEAFTLTGYTAKIGAMLPADRGYYVIAGDDMATGTISGNTITVTLPAAYTAKSGNGVLTIILTGSGATIRPINVDFRIQKSADAADTVAGASDFPASLAQIVDDWITNNSSDTVTQWLEDALDVQSLEDVIDAWLDDHPEATTTVEDGSITVGKLHDSLKAFVTPQMYGAKADGETDDTQAIQDAIDSGYNVYFPSGTYAIYDTITIQGRQKFTLDASNAIIRNRGTGYAFYLRAVQSSTLLFNAILCANTNGGCVHMYGSREDASVEHDWIQYLNIYFHQFYSGTSGNCIYVENRGTSWINEVRVHNGRFEQGANGVLFDNDASVGINHWVFSEVGVEGVTNGFKFERGSTTVSANKYYATFVFENMRTAEATSIMQTDGCRNFRVTGAYDISSKLTLDSASTGWILDCTFPEVNTYSVVNGEVVARASYGRTLTGVNKIAANSDVDDITKIGEYFVDTNADAATLSNLPTNRAGRLTVEYGLGSDYFITQRYETLVTNAQMGNHIYKRTLENHGTWGAWIDFKDTGSKNLGQHTVAVSASKVIDLTTSVIPTGIYLVCVESTGSSNWNYVGILSFLNQIVLTDIYKGTGITVSVARTASNVGTLTITNGSASYSMTVDVTLTKL